MVVPAGTVLGHYKIISRLGFGAMGEVYLAQDLNLRRSVALKILTLDPATSPLGQRRFIQEARTASALKHPNIAHIYEIAEADDLSFIAMEYIEGVTLREHGNVTLNEALDIAEQVASALVAAHAVGVVHRDLKPENIMLSRDGYVKVLDFGLAKTVTRGQQFKSNPEGSTASTVFTDPGSVVGTVTYMSPEQARGLNVDQRSDIWSLGVIMYEMIAARTPFQGETVSDIISNILNREPQPMARFARNVPESVEWLVMKALNKDREGRHQTAKELLSDIRRIKQRLSIEAELSGLSGDRTSGRGSSEKAASADAQIRRSTEPMSSVEYIVSGITTHKKAAVTTVVLLFLAMVGAVFGVVYVARSWRSTTSGPVARSLTRLTVGSGLQNGPTWSPDGRFIAYSSDRNGNFAIWVQPVGGGDPIQVTHSSSHDWQPDWSPDGNSIVFRSEREGSGLYVAPAFGGRERKIASFGYDPRWSPDGSKILCLSPGDGYFDLPRIFIVNVDGTPPVEVSTSGTGQETWIRQKSVAWHPDSQRISFLANDGSFWTMPIAGGKPAKPDVAPAVAKQLQDAGVRLEHFCWAPSGSAIFFEGESKGIKNLWKITVDPQTLAWVSGPERLTTGLGPDTEIALSKDGKRLAFVTVTRNTRIWSLPFDPLTGQVKGTGQPLTAADLDAAFPDVSPDGSSLAFTARRQGTDKQELWLQSLKDHSSKLLAVDDFTRFMPRWSPDGKYLAYSRYRAGGPEDERAYIIVLLPIGGGEEKVITSESVWRDYVYDWSPDGQWIAGSSNRNHKDRWDIVLFPVSEAPHAETAIRTIVADPQTDLWAPRFSPDGRWIVYKKDWAEGVSVLNVVPAGGGTSVQITSDPSWSDKPRWSLDGKTIYFISNHGTMFLNVWGIRFDPVAGKPVGEPFRITSFENPGQIISTRISSLEMTLDQNRLFLPITQLTGSIWVLGDVDR
jgi:serine/threonine protein kinase/sugar lactone lactonase YvrE